MSKTRKRQLRYQIANKLKLLKTRYLRFITHFESKIRQLSIMLSVFRCVRVCCACRAFSPDGLRPHHSRPTHNQHNPARSSEHHHTDHSL